MQMNENMRTIYANMKAKTDEIKKIPVDDEHEETLKTALDELDAINKTFDLAKRAYEAERAFAAAGSADSTDGENEANRKGANGFELIAKSLLHQDMSPEEKAILTPKTGVSKALVTGGTSGESLLIPEDVRTAINELRRSFVSLRDLGIVTSLPTQSMSGSFVFEAGTIAGLTSFTDGAEIDQTGGPSFARKTFTIGLKGKIIPVSNVLTLTERAGLLAYLNRWFVKNAVFSENADIIAELKADKTATAIAGSKALKSALNTDLDPDCKAAGRIITNQTGFNFLDQETDTTGRPLLQPDPTNATLKRLYGLDVTVLSTSQLADEADGSFPIFCGDTASAIWMMMLLDYLFASSTEAGFTKNQTYLRVMEGYDVVAADKDAYFYGKMKAAT